MSNLELTSVFRSHPLHMQLDQRNKGANSVLFICLCHLSAAAI